MAAVGRLRTVRATMSPIPILALMLVAAAPTPEPNPGDDGGAADMELAGDTLIEPTLAYSAFVHTRVGFHEGVDYLSAPDLPAGPLGNVDLHAFDVRHTLELGLRFAPWLGLDATAEGRILTSVDGGSKFLGGPAADGAIQVAPVLRLFRVEETGTQLSLRLLGTRRWTDRPSVVPLADQLELTPMTTLRSMYHGNLGHLLVVPGSEYRLGLGVYLAQSLGTILAIQLSTEPEFAWSVESPWMPIYGGPVDYDGHAFRLVSDGLLSLNLAAVHIPIAITFEMLYVIGQDNPGDLPGTDLHGLTMAGGIYYSARRNLQLGLVGSTEVDPLPLIGVDANGQPAISGKPTVLHGELVLRYVF